MCRYVTNTKSLAFHMILATSGISPIWLNFSKIVLPSHKNLYFQMHPGMIKNHRKLLTYDFYQLAVCALYSAFCSFHQNNANQNGRQTARSLILFRLTSVLFVKSCTKLDFGATLWGIKGNICVLSEIFNKKKSCSRVSSRECQFYL